MIRYKNKSLKRKTGVRFRLKSDSHYPRLTIFRSLRYIYAQIIDDTKGVTLVSANSKKLGDKKTNKLIQAQAVGREIAKLAKKKKIKTIVFDRGSYQYHGRVKALAEAARQEGLKF